MCCSGSRTTAPGFVDFVSDLLCVLRGSRRYLIPGKSLSDWALVFSDTYFQESQGNIIITEAFTPLLNIVNNLSLLGIFRKIKEPKPLYVCEFCFCKKKAPFSKTAQLSAR